MNLTDVESRVLEHVDEKLLVDSLVAFIRVPSVTGTDAESDLQHAHAKILGDAGLDVDTWKFDMGALRADDRFPGEETGRTEGYGVVGMTGSGYPALPTLHYGPGNVNFAHAPREQVALAEFFAVARSLTLLAVRRCGGHF